MLKNSPPAQRALMLLDHDPQSFWHALEFYFRFADPSDVATGLRGSVPSLDAENRSQLALFIAGPEAGSQPAQSSPQALNSEIARVSKQTGFKASVEAFLRANPRAIAQLSSRLLQDLLEVAENPHAVAGLQRPDGHSGFIFGENDRPSSGRKRGMLFELPSWALPLGAFFIGSIITALVISSLFGRSRPASQTVVSPVYFATARPAGSPQRVTAPSGYYGVPPQAMTQQIGTTAPPVIGPPLNNIVGSGAPVFDRRSNRAPQAMRRGAAATGAGKSAARPSAASAGAETVARALTASGTSKPAPAASETPLTVQPEDQTFVAVPQPSPAPVSSLSPSELMLAIPTPAPAAVASPAPTATPTPKGRKRIRLGYRCAKCR